MRDGGESELRFDETRLRDLEAMLGQPAQRRDAHRSP
jgi:hypothetical protein